MPSFGGSAICPRCSKAVYAAEQVLGPGRKYYHKPCLSCTSCSKRLDSFTLLEHDEEPYCKSCHAKNFGTHNVPNRTADPLRTPPRRPTVDSSSPSSPDTQSSPSRPSNTGRFGPDGLPRTVQLSPTRIPEDSEQVTDADDENTSRPMAPVAERYAAAAAVQRRHMTGDGQVTPPRSIPRTLTGGSPSPRRYGADNPACARCGKSVFFAEQVKAVNKVFHKSCLRCTVCSTSLDSNRLRDHEGEPHCSRCYTKLWGPGGLDK
ncbi:LIM-domain-containing protein [Roridomyces roridus]|uniref:LIM-domain-containing protein n=1 Tax=Roridomyces roridus TaxID=1738132 RepID=A0AAD7BFE3_9AGAR|nr:LIM-domain-containing protein [Roridomyces roridus]